MDDVERLLLDLRPPPPSRALDERIRRLVAPRPVRHAAAPWRAPAAFAAALGIAVGLGFWVGRNDPFLRIRGHAPQSAASRPAVVAEAPLPPTGFALVGLERRPEGLFGDGALKVRIVDRRSNQ